MSHQKSRNWFAIQPVPSSVTRNLLYTSSTTDNLKQRSPFLGILLFTYFFCVSQLDVLVHRLVTLLADTGDSKSAESRIFDANLACRKLAVSHPVLLLRYKSSISRYNLLSCPTRSQSSPLTALLSRVLPSPDTCRWSQASCTGASTSTCWRSGSRTTWRFSATCSPSWSCCSRSSSTTTTRGRFKTASCPSWRFFRWAAHRLYRWFRPNACQQSFATHFFDVPLCVELSEVPFAVSLHQQVFTVHAEVHHPQCSCCHTLFTEALWHLAVSAYQHNVVNVSLLNKYADIWPSMALLTIFIFLLHLPGFCVQKIQTWFSWNLFWLDSLCRWKGLPKLHLKREMVRSGGSNNKEVLLKQTVHTEKYVQKNI